MGLLPYYQVFECLCWFCHAVEIDLNYRNTSRQCYVERMRKFGLSLLLTPLTTLQHREYDLLIVGTGMGGGTLAYALRESGLRILLIERGDYLPREPENWMPSAVFAQNRYNPAELWYDTE